MMLPSDVMCDLFHHNWLTVGNDLQFHYSKCSFEFTKVVLPIYINTLHDVVKFSCTYEIFGDPEIFKCILDCETHLKRRGEKAVRDNKFEIVSITHHEQMFVHENYLC